MLAIRKPREAEISVFLRRQATLPFSYPEVGATAGELPEKYTIHRTQGWIGHGDAVFQSAKRALQTWQQLRLGWVDCWPHDAPIEAGVHVAVVGQALGLWWRNACRVVFTINESGTRFGFAYGTLPGHVACGEERFLIEKNPRGDVRFDILSFSKPSSLFSKLGYAWMARAQQRFGRESVARLAVLSGKPAAAESITQFRMLPRIA